MAQDVHRRQPEKRVLAFQAAFIVCGLLCCASGCLCGLGFPLQKNVGYEYPTYGLLPCFAWISKAKGSLKAAWNGFQAAFFIVRLIKQIENIVAIVFI